MAQSARNQPQGLARINRGNTFGLSLDALVIGGNPVNIATGKQGTLVAAMATKAERVGRTFDTGAAVAPNANSLDLGTGYNYAGPFTLFWYGRLNALSSGGYDRLFTKDVGGGAGNWQLALNYGNGSSPAFFMQDSANAGQNVTTTTGGVSLTTHELIVVTHTGTQLLMYRNGVLSGSLACTTFPGTNGNPLKLGGGTSGFGAAMSVAMAGVGRGSITAAQAKAWAQNPYQILDAPSQSQFPMLAAAGGAVNGLATPTGVSAASSVGSASASGTAKAAPLGVSAAASVGTATASGTTVVNGTATPLGVSATASVGTANASGGTVISATAQPSGVAASASVGTAAATGSAAAQPAGVAAAATVGAATSTGDASAAPAGVSALASVGVAVASGPVNATAFPLGVAAVASVGAAVFSQPSTGDGANFRGGNWRGWDEKAWRKRKGLPDIAQEVRTAWEGLKASPAAVIAEAPAAIKPIISAAAIQPQALDLAEIKALMRAWEGELARRDEEEEDDLLTLLAL